jgi:TetR/AcrR family acrAB operon transcriptional repressor
MQPAGAFLKDLEIMLRTLVAGATAPVPKPRPVKTTSARKSVSRSTSRKSGDRR